MKLADIKAMVRELDPKLEEDSDGYKALIVLLSSVVCGPNVTKLHRFTRYPYDLLNKFAYRLRLNGIWKGDKIYADWLDPEEGGVALILDSLVATGMMNKSASAN